MNGKFTPARMGLVAAVVLGVLALGLFLLPWAKVTVSRSGKDRDVIQASGLQLTLGRATPLKDGEVDPDPKRKEKVDETVQVRPWFALGLAAPVAIVVIGLLGALGTLRGPVAGLVIAIAAGLGLVGAVSVATVDYAKDSVDHMRAKKLERLKQNGREPSERDLRRLDEGYQSALKRAREQAPTTTTAMPWVSLALYVLAAGAGAAAMILPRLTGQPAGAYGGVAPGGMHPQGPYAQGPTPSSPPNPQAPPTSQPPQGPVNR